MEGPVTRIARRTEPGILDPAVADLIEALARAAARRDNASVNASMESQQATHAPRRDLRPLLLRPAE